MDVTKLVSRNDTNYISLKGFKGNQFGHKVVTVQCKVNDVLKFLEIDREVQRELDEAKVASIGQYITYGSDGNNIFFAPLIFSSRGRGTFNEVKNEFNLNMNETMAILDGQHRIKAFELIKNRIESIGESGYKYDYVTNFPITVQIFLDLTTTQEKQLFTDINTKASLVNSSLLIMYNKNDLYARLVQDIIENLPQDVIETRSKTTTTKIMTASTFYKTARILNHGALNLKQKTSINKNSYSSCKGKTESFITLLRKYAPIDGENRNKYIIMTPNIIMAIAYFIYDTQTKYPTIAMEELFQSVITKVNWSHKNSEFEKLKSGVYNKKTKKYNFNSSLKTIKEFSDFLQGKLSEERGGI
ncbi:DGQHR domain-containing protein [Virgibacillus halodenitrificans]|uniref:DNA sulfur modification protein DndB n=1 Tax=Virgibacillus halodenitrificans TaxID=1482 RepID=UPI001FB1BC6E|nr:DNA sulfur modification protein DndB [Virgibacillus halodenitrificans]MCJ0931909.1 DGQHR domain-containing protein [Virgibacillus halodenitrificans]